MYISTLMATTNRTRVNKKLSFCTYVPTLPERSASFRTIISSIDAGVRIGNPIVNQSALNNCHGDWYEWLLAISAWNWQQANRAALRLVKLPNITRFNVGRLYRDDLYEMIEDLRKKVRNAAGVSLITSNPDFVLVNAGQMTIPGGLDNSPITNFDEIGLEMVDSLYLKFQGLCKLDDIVGYLSAKISLRGDRRLQLPHEGSLMKALYAHLQTRQWLIDPPGLKYYACASKLGLADFKALETVATHSITTVFSTPQPAVDKVFKIDSLQEAESVWQEVLLA